MSISTNIHCRKLLLPSTFLPNHMRQFSIYFGFSRSYLLLNANIVKYIAFSIYQTPINFKKAANHFFLIYSITSNYFSGQHLKLYYSNLFASSTKGKYIHTIMILLSCCSQKQLLFLKKLN